MLTIAGGIILAVVILSGLALVAPLAASAAMVAAGALVVILLILDSVMEGLTILIRKGRTQVARLRGKPDPVYPPYPSLFSGHSVKLGRK